SQTSETQRAESPLYPLSSQPRTATLQSQNRNRLMSEPQTIAVLGAGTMGNGIAHVCARSGFSVVLCDLEQLFLDRALATIEKNLAREVGKEKLTQQQATEA